MCTLLNIRICTLSHYTNDNTSKKPEEKHKLNILLNGKHFDQNTSLSFHFVLTMIKTKHLKYQHLVNIKKTLP